MALHELTQSAHWLEGERDLDELLSRARKARLVLIGEATHGTSEFAVWRSRLTQRLLSEGGFSFVAVADDWPYCYSLNRYVKGYRETATDVGDALHRTSRWPAWTLSNWETAAFLQWLRRFNRHRVGKTGFYGLDVYSLRESLNAVIGHLRHHAPDSLSRAIRATGCFEPGGDSREYHGPLVTEARENRLAGLLTDLRRRASQFPDDLEGTFDAEQNALVMVNAERYYRTLLRGGPVSWNLRELHMRDTLERLLAFHGPGSRAIVWAHNQHVGDARATAAAGGKGSLGQLLRQRFGRKAVFLAGQGCHHGKVLAGRQWGDRPRAMRIPPAADCSWDDLLYRELGQNAYVFSTDVRDVASARQQRAQRTIGVTYLAEKEQQRNYISADLPREFDAFIEVETSTPIHPLDHDGAERPRSHDSP